MLVGCKAPDFTLLSASGREVNLTRELQQKPLVLVFYPFAFSQICDGEIAELIENIQDFIICGVGIYFISCDSIHALAKYATEFGVDTDMFLSDYWPHGGVATKYKALSDKGYAIRKTVFIAQNASIKDEIISDVSRQRSIFDTLEKMRKIKVF